MQVHPCVNCKRDSTGGASIVHGGMFMKMCAECYEDEEIMRNMNDYWRKLEEEEYRKYEDEVPVAVDT